MPPLLMAGAAALFVGLVIGVLALAAPHLRHRGASRVESIEEYLGLSATPEQQESASRGIAEEIVAFGERVMRDRDSTPRLLHRLQQADLPLRPGEWWVLRVVSVVVGLAAGMVLLGERARLLGAVIGLAVGLVGPAVVLRALVRRRIKAFEHQLPEVLMLVASSLATGFSLMQALDTVARDASEPAAKEFGRALAETRIGTDVEISLQALAQRMESRNMEWTAMAIQIQRTVGGNLAETLRTTSATLREREMLKRQVAALSAEGKMSAYILVALPLVVFVFLLRANYEYVSLLWTRPLGLVMVVAGMVSLGIGIAWMRSLVNLKV